MLMIFTISIAPKTYFHDLIANHKDRPDCIQLHKTAVLHKKSFHCHFDDIVVTAPFLLLNEQPDILKVFYQEAAPVDFYSFLYQSHTSHKESRGPPAIEMI